jgi:hypothetical protein
MDINNTDHIESFKKLVDSPDILESILDYRKELDNPADEFKTKKLIDCPHEIIFTITAQTLSQNDKGEIIESKDICVKNYHIPVPIDKDYHNYMEVFFDYLEKKILESVSDSNETAQDNKELNKNE